VPNPLEKNDFEVHQIQNCLELNTTQVDHKFLQFKIEHFSADGEPGSNWGDRSIQTISGQVNQVKQNMFQEQSYRRYIFNIKRTGNDKHA
jgi:hypothetical protein